VTDTKQEVLPSIVPTRAKQGGQIYAASERWSWVAPAVWTPRMLQALEQGVKGGVWYSLMDKVYAMSNLEAACKRVVSNKGSAGVDYVTVQMYEKDRDANLQRLHEQLRDGTYRPQQVRRVYIPKPGSQEKRPLGIPTVRDRIAQAALRNVLEPIFERDFAEHSYGFRPERGCKDALRRVDAQLRTGDIWVVEVDLKSYFDTIPHTKLMDLVKTKVADSRVICLLESYLKQRVLEEVREWTPQGGTPQGAVISPLLANVYLDPLDHMMEANGLQMTRYADDMVILCRTEDDAQRALELLKQWVETAGLTLHPTKTRVVQVSDKEGFDFLGYHFQFSRKEPDKLLRWPRTKSLANLRNVIRPLTKRTNGWSLETIIAKLNPRLVGFFEYFKHSTHKALRMLDGWVRQRIRGVLRRRNHQYGRATRRDHLRWQNAFFHAHGLFSMAEARGRILQSSSEVNH
jgi:RNA-directed DNA polymerase